MGTIVTLPLRRRKRPASVQAGDDATILLFMGVRYVRDPAPEHPKPIAAERQPAALERA